MKDKIILITIFVAMLLTIMGLGVVGCALTQAQPPTSTPTSTPTPTVAPTPTPSPTTTPTPSGQPVTINLTAKNIKFDMGTITVPAGVQVTINFSNQDNGIPHNVSVYTDSSASKSIFVGQPITGIATTTYTFTAPSTPGNYFFRCDVHPTLMTGTFIVQ